jgi:hypothetical protein
MINQGWIGTKKSLRQRKKSARWCLTCLYFFGNVYKKPQNLSKCPTLMKKASIFLEIILTKASNPLKKPHIHITSILFSENVLKKPHKSLKLIIKSIHYSENVFKKSRICSKYLWLLEKPQFLFIWFEKASNFF